MAGALPRRTGRPRLLVVTSTFPASPGDGTPGFVLDLARVQARSFDTVVVAPRVPGAASRERVDGVEIRRFGYFPRRWEDLAHGAIIENLRSRPTRWSQVLPLVLAEVLAIRRAVVEYQPDVVHLHWMVPQGVAALAGARRVPWLVTAHGADLYALADPLSRWLKSAVLRRARTVTTMNEEMRRLLVELGAPPESTLVRPMGAHVDQVRRVASTQPRLPGRLVFAGRLVDKKGVAVLLEALRLLPSTLDWSLDVVGDGPLRAALERSAAGLPVRFHGQLDAERVARRLGAAEIAILPSIRAASGDQDGRPVVLVEAMAAGCAVVASELAGIDEAVVDGETGLLVPPGDARALARALSRLLAEPELRRSLGKNASARADDFGVEKVGAQYVRLLRDTAGPTGP